METNKETNKETTLEVKEKLRRLLFKIEEVKEIQLSISLIEKHRTPSQRQDGFKPDTTLVDLRDKVNKYKVELADMVLDRSLWVGIWGKYMHDDLPEGLSKLLSDSISD